ncbi:MAG: hypothetical protein V2I36_04695 [Desulfopila sp.]|nr:hypothetical protein [Desulfopila sp.]
MTLFLITSVPAFLLFAGAVICINYSKSRKIRNSRHQLTGMCHRSGAVSCCGSSLSMEKQTSQCGK